MVRSSSPVVVIAAMICLTVIVLAVIAGALMLAITDHGAMAVITMLGAVITPWIVQVFGRVVSFFADDPEDTGS
jgi:hypothetical protein